MRARLTHNVNFISHSLFYIWTTLQEVIFILVALTNLDDKDNAKQAYEEALKLSDT